MTIREVTINKGFDPDHYTRLDVIPRDQDRSGERTDKRPSEMYALHSGVSGDLLLTVAFHEGNHPRDGLNGVFIKDLLAIAYDRLLQHQCGPFASEENGRALFGVYDAIQALHERTSKRKASGKLGTQKV